MINKRALTNSVHPGSHVLVWGGMGFLGQHLVTELVRQGANVSVLCRSRHLYPSPPWAGAVTWHELSRPDDEATMLVAVSSAEVIYNFAGASGAVASNLDPGHSLQANCAVQLAFLKACENASHRPHVVFASSWLVYDLRGNEPVSEGHALAPRSVYGAHKLCIENYLRIFQLRNKITFTVCRISNPYGYDPGRSTKAYKVLNSFIANAVAGTPICIFGDGCQLRDFIHISDVVEAFLLCGLPHARNEIFNISYGYSYSLVKAVKILTEIAGHTEVIFKPWPPEYRATEPGSYVADIGKAKDLLGLAPSMELSRGLQQTIRRMRGTDVDGFAMQAAARR